VKIKRISIGPGEVAGYFSRLKSGFDEIGIPCEHFFLIPNKFSYQETDYFLKSIFTRIVTLRDSSKYLIRRFGWAIEKCLQLLIFIYALIRCDVFIFSGFCSFFRFLELPLLKLLRKKVIVVYVGSDSRPPIISGKHLDDSGGFISPLQTQKETLLMLRGIKRVEAYASVILTHTASAQFFSNEFVRVNAVGTPMSVTSPMSSSTDKGEESAVRIVHAPSRPLAKGSTVVRDIIENLRAEGYCISLVELVGVPNSTVLQELEKCDFVIDEVYSDAPMCGLATEAAVFGKPVVVGGYYADHYKIDNPDLELPPTFYVDPENLKQAIRKMIVDREFRLNMGKMAQEFVNDAWCPRTVARNYLQLIEGDIPEHWKANPLDLEYFWGWGLSKENWLLQVKEYVEELGEDALMFNHNPRLKKRILDELGKTKAAPLS
jgi:hypothetical protein